MPNPRDLTDLLATIRRVKPTFFNGVPTLYIALLNHPDVQKGKVDFKSIRICFSGAAPLLADTKSRFEAMTGGRIVEGYSLTEAMMAICVNPVKGPNKIGSVGMPLPDVSVRIFDGDEGTRVLPAKEVGEIAIVGAAADGRLLESAGRNRRRAARSRATDGVTRRWLHTGDLGYLDEDGYLFIVDRKKDLIKTSGYQVWPREIEEVLASHPAVAEVGVAGDPGSDQGRSGEGVGRAARRTDRDRSRAARVLPREAGALQSAGARRVPHGAAEDAWSARCSAGDFERAARDGAGWGRQRAGWAR